ncbi:MAG: hypothetical protein Pg6A_12500 [Termitinemataceae bacterium]|nr:MAG: hypothetical protein Pg6A_12500 [Termitinemataceae bacterium]
MRVMPEAGIGEGTGYQGIARLRADPALPKKKTKKNPPDKAGKAFNRAVSSKRVLNGHVTGCVKRFRIVSDKYRSRRKRFGLRFNLIAAIYNLNLVS